jgi:hypothetical protein
MKLDEKGRELPTLSDFIKMYQCNMVGFSELNLDVSKYKARQIIADTFGKSFEAVQWSMITSEIPFKGFYKPGGTLTATFENHVSRFHGKFADSMGQWSTVSLTGKQGLVIHFVTVYQVADSPTTGPYTVYQQQASTLNLADRTIKPRAAFIHDLLVYLRSIKTDHICKNGRPQ